MFKRTLLTAVASLALAGCPDEEQEAVRQVEVPTTTPELWAFEPAPPPPPEPEPPPPPPEPVVYEPPPEPEPPPPPPPVIEPPPFVDPAPALRAAEVAMLRAERRRNLAPVIQRASLPEPAFDVEPEPIWDLKDEDYSRDNLEEDESTLPVDRYRVITADRYIPAILENAVNSQIPGRFIALVERHVFGSDGRIPLLPKGTRIICYYESLAKQGDTRLPSMCVRAILPNGASILLTDAVAADQVARTGLVGDVDNRIWERYGSAVTVSVISALAGAGGGLSDNPMAEAGATALAQNLGQVTATILEQTIDLSPISEVAAGSRIQIIPAADIWLREPERADQPAGEEPGGGGA